MPPARNFRLEKKFKAFEFGWTGGSGSRVRATSGDQDSSDEKSGVKASKDPDCNSWFGTHPPVSALGRGQAVDGERIGVEHQQLTHHTP